MVRNVTVQTIQWRGIDVEISWEPCWLDMAGPYATGHLQIYSVAPERAKLPVSETGYRSHFLPAEIVNEAGGPLAYARAWLDHAAESADWKRYEQESRQMTLF